MFKLLVFLLITWCLNLHILAVSVNSRSSQQQKLYKPEFSPIDLNTDFAKLLIIRARLTKIKQHYEKICALHSAYIANQELLDQTRLLLMRVISAPALSSTIQSVSSTSSSGRSASSVSSGDSESTDSGTGSSTGSRLLSPSSDSDNR